jgi:hypothetical protein
MSIASDPRVIWDAEKLAQRFGPIPMDRIRTNPPPGLATEEDVFWLDEHEDRLYELVDGLLIEKTNDRYVPSLHRAWAPKRT